jgi:ribulose-phosphate 3-epimerase
MDHSRKILLLSKLYLIKAMIKIAPSILSADFSRLGEQVSEVEEAGAELVHIDVMDGHFVPNITMGPLVVRALKKQTKLPLDVHLMIENPEKYVDAFADAGSDIITVHAEACPDLPAVVQKIKDRGVKAGVAISPPTPVSALDGVIDKIQMVVVMTVNPGFGGQKFMTEVLSKVRELRERRADLDIEIDGGICVDTAPQAVEAGANILVAGNAIFGNEDIKKALQNLLACVSPDNEK